MSTETSSPQRHTVEIYASAIGLVMTLTSDLWSWKFIQ